MADLELQVDHGWTVWYAVDHAEVHSYVLPDTKYQRIRVFHEDDPNVAQATHWFVLNYLFFESPNGVVQLPPYLLELDTFIDDLQWHVVREIALAISEQLLEAETLVQDPNYGVLLELAGQISGSHAPAAKADIDRFQQLLEERAPRLIVLADLLQGSPFRRLNTLLERGRLKELFDLGIYDLVIDYESESMWQEGLDTTRPHRQQRGANQIDARAMATLKAVNLKLQPEKIRIQLVTDSSAMHKQFRSLVRQGDWNEEAWGSLRHPRAFAALQAVVHQDASLQLRHVQLEHQSVEVFLLAYEQFCQQRKHNHHPVQPSQQVSDYVSRELEVSLRTIVDQWHSSTTLSSSLAAGRQSLSCSSEDRVKQMRERLLSVFRLLVESRQLRERIVSYINELASEIDRQNQLMPLVLHSMEGRQERVLRTEFRYDPAGYRMLLRSTVHHMPYYISLESEALRSWSAQVDQRKEVSVIDVLELLKHCFSLDLDYEVLLFIGYVFGAWGRWDLTLRYCELALSARAQSANRARHEGLFLLAVATHRAESTLPASYARALELVRQARAELRSCAGGDALEDPRFLKEEGTIVQLWHEITPKPRSKQGDQDIQRPWPPMNAAIDLYRDALALIDNDPRLEAQIYNNLCYYFIQSSSEDARHKASEYLSELRRVSAQIADDDAGLPPGIVDTLVWASWQLADFDSRVMEQESSVARMKRLLERPLIRRQSEVCHRHLHEIISFAPTA